MSLRDCPTPRPRVSLTKRSDDAWVRDEAGAAPIVLPSQTAPRPSPRNRVIGTLRVASILGLAALFLEGCAPRTSYAPPPEYVWVHPTSTDAQFRADSAFCNAQATRAVPSPPPAAFSYPPPPLTEQFQDNVRRTNEATRTRLEREHQFNLCMQSLGYSRVRRY